jgi:hypothetical protein
MNANESVVDAEDMYTVSTESPNHVTYASPATMTTNVAPPPAVQATLVLPPPPLPISLLPPPPPQPLQSFPPALIAVQPSTAIASQPTIYQPVVAPPPLPFRAKVLTTRELSHATEQVLRDNVKLGEDDKRLIARMYDTFRLQLMQALQTNDHAVDKFFWVELLGNMMIMASTFRTSGVSKKEIIMETLRLIIKFEIAPERQDHSLDLLESVISPAIDLTIYFKNQMAAGKSCAWCCLFH